MKVITIVGARPQFIKAAAVSRAFRHHADVEELIVHTGQHYDHQMSDLFFNELSIPAPRYNLGIGSGTHGAQTGRMLEAIEGVMLEVKPDMVLVYGDTNSTLAGAVAASKLHIPVAHVEAGLRSFNRRMPEEINRVVADHLSEVLYAPTDVAVTNLVNEGIERGRIEQIGDVMYDVTLFSAARMPASLLETLGLTPRKYVLATVHRAENTDDPARLTTILDALGEFSRELPVVLPVHPRTRNVISSEPALSAKAKGIRLIEPVGYLDMTALEHYAAVIATDSGGVQKEAFFHRVPCVTLRDETEWVELVELGWNRLCPPLSKDAVVEALRSALSSTGDPHATPYGDGKAAERVVASVRNLVSGRTAA